MELDIATIIIFAFNVVLSAVVGYGAASFRVGEYKNKVDALENTVGKDEHAGLRKTVGDVRDKVVSCETSLKEREPLIQSKSPISLSNRGADFLDKSEGRQFVDKYFDEFLKQVEALSPKNAYDVQESSKKVIEKLKNDDRLNDIKEFLFKDGSTLDDVFIVMSVYLRDKILKHKNWNVSDIDNHKTLN
jgi:hypothetical protein